MNGSLSCFLLGIASTTPKLLLHKVSYATPPSQLILDSSFLLTISYFDAKVSIQRTSAAPLRQSLLLSAPPHSFFLSPKEQCASKLSAPLLRSYLVAIRRSTFSPCKDFQAVLFRFFGISLLFCALKSFHSCSYELTFFLFSSKQL
ncbi:hypothetical protein KSP39_PZI018792 [Platanthera zijinensis]|uniref:Uncharacterized protein n=1 Tax=Platanthera zijinensis TaxID=2320716 RepID=A0AAP0B2W1_9ASPA